MPSPTSMGPYPYYPVEFTKDGDVYSAAQLTAVVTAVGTDAAPPANGLTDLFVISHGWNDDMADAEALYAGIFGQVQAVLQQSTAASTNVGKRQCAVVGILWPSKRFDEADLIPGGGAAAFQTGANADGVVDGISRLVAVLNPPQDAPADTASPARVALARAAGDDTAAALDRAKELVSQLSTSSDARDEFVRIVRAFMPHDVNDEESAIPDEFYTLDGDELLRRLSRPVAPPPAPGSTGGAASLGGGFTARDAGSAGGGAGGTLEGGAAGITDWIGRAVDGAKNLLNLVTYYQMKSRAGVVGQHGAYDMLRQIRAARPATGANPLRLHLLGHSFGCRLVSAAVAGPDGAPPLTIDSLTLLQAAFSHYGFAQAYDGAHDGLFRRVVADPPRVRGPVLITFTAKDKAVGLAYPIASRIARQVAAAMGDANDPYGGLGRNGAQKTPSAQVVTMAPVGIAYPFAPRGIYNLDANAIIAAHSDVAHPEVAYAIVSAVATT